MPIAQLLNTPCTIIRRSPSGDEDDYGNEEQKPEDVETVCEVQKQVRRASEEPGDQGELSDTLWTGFFPAGTELRTGDAVRVDALGEFEMVGDPWPVWNPRTKAVSHIEASLRRTVGADEAS